MNVNDILKTQMILQMGSASGRHSPIYNLLAMNFFDMTVKTFPAWSMWLMGCCRSRKKTVNANSVKVRPHDIRASIVCERGIQQSNNKQASTTLYGSRMDAVVHYVTTLPAMKNLISVTHHDYLPNEFDAICLEPDVYFELTDMKIDDGQLTIVKFKLFCYEHDVQHLQAFIDNCNTDYERRMLNKLGTNKYFFDQMVPMKSKGTQNPLPTTHLVYTKTKFTTNRTFKNVFFEERPHVETRTNFFLKHRDWYDKKGIPYTLGFMFHGSPGTGKTSTVKAIANEARRHIINIQLSEIKTKQQLHHLFFNDEIHVHNGISTEKYTIPVNERLYVIEDIDAMGDVVLRREWKKPTAESVAPKPTGDPFFDRDHGEEKETLDLSFLLNLLDGTLEANGRILIITTNFPERIDRALIRPGRIDMIVDFKKCNLAIIREMIASFYEKDYEIPDNPAMNYRWSPAEVNQILFRNFNDPEQAIRELFENENEIVLGE